MRKFASHSSHVVCFCNMWELVGNKQTLRWWIWISDNIYNFCSQHWTLHCVCVQHLPGVTSGSDSLTRWHHSPPRGRERCHISLCSVRENLLTSLCFCVNPVRGDIRERKWSVERTVNKVLMCLKVWMKRTTSDKVCDPIERIQERTARFSWGEELGAIIISQKSKETRVI